MMPDDPYRPVTPAQVRKTSPWRALLDGVASIFGAWYLPPPPPPMNDEQLRRRVAEDMASDWRAVGNDLRKAMRQVDKEINR